MHGALLLAPAVAIAVVAAACGSQPGSLPPRPVSLATAESLYLDLRDIRDRIDVGTESGRVSHDGGGELGRLVAQHNALRLRFSNTLGSLDTSGLGAEDARALGVMRTALPRDLVLLPVPDSSAEPIPGPPDCDYDARTLVQGEHGLDSLRSRMYACYAWAQSHVVLAGDTTDRLSVLSRLGHTEDPERRRELFLSLAPVWRSVNGDNSSGSPYRRLIAREVAGRRGAEPPATRQARASGLPPDSLESWLLRVLETWRSANPDSMIEPWDWYYQTGRASRHLSQRISRERLTALNREVYRSLGADVDQLGVHYDLEPREGKTPVAFCTFASRPRFIDGRWLGARPWVFATYRAGGLDNLSELLHETGHAVHIAAIRTRPAFADWPDSDPFTEAVADFVALEVSEPEWQQRWLGDSVPLADGLRGRYGSIVLDVAWSLFELKMQRDTAADPNQVWTALTSTYLRIRPHPKLSWWAMRGQLINVPGYMMNYAAGSILIAAIRERTRQVHGPFTRGDSTWYGWIAPRLFRFGLERPTRQVIEDFLGGPLSPAALLADMGRMKGPR